jgi:hypothetical protein
MVLMLGVRRSCADTPNQGGVGRRATTRCRCSWNGEQNAAAFAQQTGSWLAQCLEQLHWEMKVGHLANLESNSQHSRPQSLSRLSTSRS